MILPLRMSLELIAVKVDLAQFSRAVPLGLIVEVRGRRIAAFSACRHGPRPHAVAELDHDEAVAAGAGRGGETTRVGSCCLRRLPRFRRPRARFTLGSGVALFCRASLVGGYSLSTLARVPADRLGLLAVGGRPGSGSSSTVCDAKWRQLVDSTQGDASRREILVSRRLSQSSENRPCYPQLRARS